MEIEILSKNDEEVRVLLKGVNHSLVNGIRRTILNKVENVAVERIEVNKNTSGMYNEVLAHRLAMIPFRFVKSIQNRNKCECETIDCVKCAVRFVIKKKGPGMVYSKDIKTTHEDFVPLYDNIPIVLLLEDQEIDVEGIITLGTGKDHAKYIPAIVGVKEKEKDVYEIVVETISSIDPLSILKDALKTLKEEIKKEEKQLLA